MSLRDEILVVVWAHLPKVARPNSPMPVFDRKPPVDMVKPFGEVPERMDGELLEVNDGDPLTSLRAKLSDAKVVCTNAPELYGNKPLGPDTKPADLADVDDEVVRPAFGIPATDSVRLTGELPGATTLGHLHHQLIMLLDPADIVPNIHHVYRSPNSRCVHHALFQTSPSANANIGGTLFHGAQGLWLRSVLPLARIPSSSLRRTGTACSAVQTPSS